jgi:leader peptidase (prepilin peptidase)/N-methyltransferase
MCSSCRAPTTPRDRLPVLSWLLSRGRCSSCGSAVSARRPLVDLASAGLLAGVAARIGYNWDLPAYLILFPGLLTLACTDLEQLALPKRILHPVLGLVGALLVLAAAATGCWHDLLVAGLSAIAWFVAFFVLNAVSPRLLGFGDVRLALLLGLALGWLGVRYVLLGFFAANSIGAAIGIVLIVTKRVSRGQQIPYGSFLALGAAIAIFAGPQLLSTLGGR